MINNQENYQKLMKMPPSTTPPILHHGITAKQIILLREELDIEDEMNEEQTKELDDDPYFLLAQRLANAPQVKVTFFTSSVKKSVLEIASIDKFIYRIYSNRSRPSIKLDSNFPRLLLESLWSS